MTLSETLVSIWQQIMVENAPVVDVGGQKYNVAHTRTRGLRSIDFEYEGRQFTGIEQNPGTGSRWATLARRGQRLMQFSCARRYIGNVAEGKLLRYPAWKGLELPD